MDKQILDGRLIIAMSRAYRSIHKESEVLLRQRGITMSQFVVMEALLHKGDLSIKQLIAAVLSNSGNMTVVVRNLEKLGMVARKENPADKRSFLISLTQMGRKLIESVFPEHMKRVRAALSVLSEQEQVQTITVLKKLSEG